MSCIHSYKSKKVVCAVPNIESSSFGKFMTYLLAIVSWNQAGENKVLLSNGGLKSYPHLTLSDVVLEKPEGKIAVSLHWGR